MKITCSQCKQIYNVDPSKIPPGITTTKCKACGNAISLKPSFPKTPSAKKNGIEITCQYCSQKYFIDPKKIPAGATTTKCKACGHSISLKPELLAPSRQEPLKIPPQKTNVRKITCLYCNQKYNIDAGKIPPSITTTKCKACGHTISLKPTSSEIFAPKTNVNQKNPLPQQFIDKKIKPAPPQEVPIIHEVRKSSSPMGRKPWVLAAAAGIIAVVLTVYFAGSNLTELTGDRFGLSKFLKKGSEIQAKGPKTPALTDAEPFLAANINVPLLLRTIENRIPEEKKDLKYKMTTGIVKSLKLNKIQLFLYPDPEHTILPVVLAYSKDGRSLQKQLNSQGTMNPFLERLADGSYRLKTEAVPEAKQNDFPIEIYRIQLLENNAVFAPESFLDILKKGESVLLKTQVARMAASISTSQDLAALAIRIPENFHAGWERKIQDHPAFKDNPQAVMLAVMGGGVLAQLTGSLKQIEAMALGFRLNNNEVRTLSYVQQFRQGVDGAKVYQQLNSDRQDDLNVDGIILNLIDLFKDPHYQHKMRHENNRLAIEFSWKEENDKTFLTALSEATIGHLFAQSMTLEPSEGPVAIEYTEPPRLSVSVNVENLKPMISQAIQKSLFPGNYWSSGDKPRMTLTLDTLDFPNVALAELTYDVLAVLTPDGREVMRREKSQFKPKISPGSISPGYIDLNIQKGTAAEALGTAKIRFNLSMPAVLKKVEFRAHEGVGSIKESDGVWVKLGQLEKDVAKISYRGGEFARLFAFDKTGRALASKESMSSASAVSARFQGVIDTLMVVVAKKMLEYPFEIAVDLNGGQEITLSHKPENPKRWRYDRHPVVTYVNFVEEDLNNLEVKWNENGNMSWTDSLSINLSKGPFSGNINWEVHFFSEDHPIYLAGNPFYGPKDISFGLQKGELKQTNAAFGKVQLDLSSKISRLTFVKKPDGLPMVQKLPSGEIIKLRFNKNEITFETGKVKVIQTMAYDARGRRLKKDNFVRTRGYQRKIYFWGLPTKFIIDVASQSLSKTITFDIRQRPVNEDAYSKFKMDIENHREVVKTLKAIARARRTDRSHYGDDLAGLYYLYGRKKKKPMRLIEQAIAHSDPAGQERFGYDLKPYRGYYFTILSGVESGGVKKDYPRQAKKKAYTWQKGTFKAAPFIQGPDLVAVPIDKTQPTFFMQWNRIYMKQLNGSKLNYLPQNYYSSGWVEAKFYDS